MADDKAIYHYVPEMIRFYLNEEPILANVKTYLLSDPEQLHHVLGRLDELVIKPTGESGGKGVFIGPATPADELAGLADVITAHPDRWIAQEVVNLSTVPTAGSDGRLAPRHVDLRPFAVFGEDIKIVPGGLTRVALIERSMIVNSSRGGGSKDTWVLEDGQDTDRAEPEADAHGAAHDARPALRRSVGRPATATAAAVVLARIAHELFWLGRNLARAEHTARMLDGVFQASLQGRPDDPAGVTLDWSSLLAIMGAPPGEAPARRDDVLRALTLARDNPTSVVACVGRAREGARTVRDVISAEMWEAVNTTNMQLRGRRPQRAAALRARTRSTATSRSAARCSGG